MGPMPNEKEERKGFSNYGLIAVNGENEATLVESQPRDRDGVVDIVRLGKTSWLEFRVIPSRARNVKFDVGAQFERVSWNR